MACGCGEERKGGKDTRTRERERERERERAMNQNGLIQHGIPHDPTTNQPILLDLIKSLGPRWPTSTHQPYF